MIITACDAALRCCCGKPDIWDFQVGSSLRLCKFAISKRPNYILMFQKIAISNFYFASFSDAMVSSNLGHINFFPQEWYRVWCMILISKMVYALENGKKQKGMRWSQCIQNMIYGSARWPTRISWRLKLFQLLITLKNLAEINWFYQLEITEKHTCVLTYFATGTRVLSNPCVCGGI